MSRDFLSSSRGLGLGFGRAMATMCSLALGSSLATAPQSPAHLSSLSSDLNGAQLMIAKHRNRNLASVVAQSSMFDLPVSCCLHQP